jgi:microcystin degradation protein MlrC
LADLREAMPVKGVLLFMHGAMVAEGYDDCEGDTISRVREIVGPDVPIGVELDLHCHLTALMVEKATAIVTYKEYPHTDLAPRAAELYEIIARTMRGEVRPVSRVADPRMISIWRTSLPGMRRFIDRMQDLERQGSILSVSLIHGFPWGNVADVGARLLVIANGDDKLAQETADTLAREIWDMRDEIVTSYLTLDEALDRAAKAEGTVMIADVADNAGGGAPSDSSFVLDRMIERGIRNAALGYVWDPIAVKLCQEAGEGAVIDLRICGKLGPASGMPLDLRGTVRRILPNHSQTGLGSTPAPLGDSVWFESDGIDIVLNCDRSQPFNPDGFTQLGIPLAERKLIVLKSMQHFYAGFAPLAAEVLYVTTPGAIPPDFASLPLTKRSCPWWPKVANPHG